MVGAGDIELNARLTLGGLLADSGDVEEGLAEMHEVKRPRRRARRRRRRRAAPM